jgi:NAD(P)-dependent dehydrogenase (short-subunit alcohol dehydrogenase family)
MSAPVDAPPAAEWMRGRTVLVTGGGGRDDGGPGTIGWAICRLLARHGASVAVLDRDPAAAARTVEQIRDHGGTAEAVIADVTDEADGARAVAEATQRLGGLDTLVNNVARWSAGEVLDFDAEGFDAMIALNLKAAWSMIRHAAPVLPPGGAIVNISSVAARRAGTMYGLGKAATEALTAGAATSLAERGIRINAVQLGALWSGAVAASFDDTAREARRRMVALQTEGTCWDAASAVLFLASDQARWISGQILTVDGGGFGRQPYPGVSRPAVAASASASGGAGA